MNNISHILAQGIEKLRSHTQLWLTVVVALAIFASYAYVANLFIGIAQSAQEELMNVRAGVLQDSFVLLARKEPLAGPDLRGDMQAIAERNKTIVDFNILSRSTSTNNWIIINSVDARTIGSTLSGYDTFLNLAIADPHNSYTVQETRNGTRYFLTSRAVFDASSTLAGIVLTRQSLSEADVSIQNSITTSVITLIVILIALLFLFFHHARIIDYTELYRRLAEVDKLKDDFVSMASHELRTPLTIIRGYVDMLKTGNFNDSPKYQELLGQVDKSAIALNQLIADILDVARMEQGRMSFDLKPTDPAPILREVYNSFTIPARAKKQEITCDIADGVIINIDTNRFTQVMINLIGNAVKYTPEGGAIKINSQLERDAWTVRIIDTGIGMSAEDTTHLFAKFYRSPDPEARKQTGTGLGLWITKQIVETMHGKISVESIKGVGTHFIVSFPLTTRSQ